MVLLHGDMDQFERDKVINSFKKQEIPILVATDVAGRKQSLIFMYKFHSARKLRTQRMCKEIAANVIRFFTQF